MRTLPFRVPLALAALAAVAVGCDLIAGVKDRTLVEGGGGSSAGTATSATTVATTSSSAGGAGGHSVASAGAGGSGGVVEPCPEQPPDVDTLICHQKHPSSLVVHGSSLFWVNEDEGTILTVPSANSANSVAVIIADQQPGVCGLSIAGGHAYWRSRDGFIRRRSLTPGFGVEDVATAQGSSCAISVDSTRVWWVKVAGGDNQDVIHSVPLGDIEGMGDVIPGVAQVDDLDASNPLAVYWASKAKQHVRSGQKSDGMITAIGNGTAPCGVRVDPTSVFWTDNATNRIVKAKLDGTVPVNLTNLAHSPCSLALRGSYVYWLDELVDGSVNRIKDTLPGDVEVLAGKQNMPCSLAVNPAGTFVYWTTCLGGELLRKALMVPPN